MCVNSYEEIYSLILHEIKITGCGLRVTSNWLLIFHDLRNNLKSPLGG